MTTRVIPKACPSGTDAMLRFFTGSLDVAYLGLVPYWLGRLFGLPLLALEPCGRWTEAVCTRPVDGYSEDQTIRVATVFGSNAHFLAFEWGRTTNTPVVFVDLDPSEQVRALQLGLVDAICAWEPYVSTAMRGGARPVFSSSDLEFEVSDVLCASRSSVDANPTAVALFRSIHRASAQALASGISSRDAEVLSSLVGVSLEETWLDAPIFPPPPAFAAHDDGALAEATTRVEEFLRRSGLAGALGSGPSPTWEPQSDDGAGPLRDGDLLVGYSEDPMCAPFYLAQIGDPFTAHGMVLDVPKDREAERIARIRDELRDEIVLIQRLIDEDPELAVMKTGRVMERELHDVYLAAFTTSPPKRLSELLRVLEDSEVIPPLLASSADWIRKIRNVATHGEGASTDIARKTFLELLELVEWSALVRHEIEPRCGRCQVVVDPAWKKCPSCTADLVRVCSGCNMELQADWKLCPACGR